MIDEAVRVLGRAARAGRRHGIDRDRPRARAVPRRRDSCRAWTTTRMRSPIERARGRGDPAARELAGGLAGAAPRPTAKSSTCTATCRCVNRQKAAIATLDEARASYRSIDALGSRDPSAAAGYAEATAWQAQVYSVSAQVEDAAARRQRRAARSRGQVLDKRPGHMQALRAQALATFPLSSRCATKGASPRRSRRSSAPSAPGASSSVSTRGMRSRGATWAWRFPTRASFSRKWEARRRSGREPGRAGARPPGRAQRHLPHNMRERRQARLPRGVTRQRAAVR